MGQIISPFGLARISRVLLAIAILAITGTASNAELIPANRLVPWIPGVTLGVPGGIPTYRTNLIDVTKAPYNADKTGVADAAGAVQSAITAAKSNDVIYLPAGTYKFLSPVSAKSYVTIRGAGIDKTIIKFISTYGAALAIGNDSDYQWNYPAAPNNRIVSGFTKGSSNLVFSSSLAVSNQLCFLMESNNVAQPVLHTMGFPDMRRQMVRITRVDQGNNITIWPPLYWTMQANLTPKWALAQYTITRFSGVEELTINGAGSTSTAPLVNFLECHGCWAKNVKTTLGKNYMFGFTYSLQCEMRGCWADRSVDGPQSNHAGLLHNSSAACLIEDNIIYDIFPGIEVNFGSAGNVFAYNYVDGNYWGGFINGNHGPHNAFNLYEGNVSPNFQSDGYFGSASEDTLFRNWFHTEIPFGGSNIGIWAVKLNRFNRNSSIIGNLLGSSRSTSTYYGLYELGHPNIGNETWTGYAPPWANTLGANVGPGGFQEMDTDVFRTSLIKGNFYYTYANPSTPSLRWPTNALSTLDAPLGTDVMPNSLFRSAKPGWFGTNRWPAFDPLSTVVGASIPAKNRFFGITYGVGVEPPSNLQVTP